MKMKLPFAAAVMTALMLPVFALADNTIIMVVKGPKGLLPGSAPPSATAVNNDIFVRTLKAQPVRPVSTMPRTAPRPAVSEFTVTKLTDSSSPAFHTALADKALLPAVRLQLFKSNADGRPVLVMTITLKNALIVDDHTFFVPSPAPQSGDPMQSHMQRVHESITFKYESMTRTLAPGQGNVNLADWSQEPAH